MLQKMLPKIKYNIKDTSAKVYPEFEFLMKFDGGSKGNPGYSGSGAVIYHNNNELWTGSFFVGVNATNNHAEYAGLIFGLQQALEMKIESLFVQGDSELIINQMTGKYKCKSVNLFSLHERAKYLESNFKSIEFQHIPRHLNKRADELANIAIQKYLEERPFI
jgi:ribonuclease HI